MKPSLYLSSSWLLSWAHADTFRAHSLSDRSLTSRCSLQLTEILANTTLQLEKPWGRRGELLMMNCSFNQSQFSFLSFSTPPPLLRPCRGPSAYFSSLTVQTVRNMFKQRDSLLLIAVFQLLRSSRTLLIDLTWRLRCLIFAYASVNGLVHTFCANSDS